MTTHYKIAFIIIIVVLIASIFIYNDAQGDGMLRVYFLDIGQGDSIFIDTPNRKQVLIDGGQGRAVLSELGDVMPFWDRSIDVVVATHNDSDHIGGLVDVLDRYSVATVLEGGASCDSATCSAFNNAVQNENADHRYVTSGYEIELDVDVVLTVLWPETSVEDQEVASENDISVVMRLDYKDQSILLTGDIEYVAETHLTLNYADIIDVDFLKVAHHGSSTSSAEAFLEATSPIAAFIQAGQDNKFNHPHFQTTQRLDKMGIPYYRNDIHGRIELVLDGTRYIINTEK